MPELRGFTHVSLSVRDLELSNEWYQRVLGLATLVAPFLREGMYRETLLSLAGGRMALCLQQHLNNDGAAFSELRTGLDHFAFYVPSVQDFEGWLARFDDLDVPYSREPDTKEWGAMAILRDPDNIQVELHCPRR
ncbi:MAG: VOC family protein [Chloroflexota bacterium]|nr:VOC family protein [Chloroflexota bacterium]